MQDLELVTNVNSAIGDWINAGVSLNDYSSQKLTDWYTDALDKFGQLDEYKLAQGPKRFDPLVWKIAEDKFEDWCEHDLEVLRNEFLELEIRYEALLSAYHPHPPIKEYKSFVDRLIRILEKEHPKLEEELLKTTDSDIYDIRRSLLSAEDLEPKEGSISLSLLAANEDIRGVHDLLQKAYETISAVNVSARKGRKTQYADRIIILFLCKMFEKIGTKGEAASISQVLNKGEKGNAAYVYEGLFFDFVSSFFEIADSDGLKYRSNNSIGKLIKDTLNLRRGNPEFERLADELCSIESLRKMKQIIDESIS